MGFLDNLFGNLFDFDGDGKTSLDEEFLAFSMFNEMNKKNEDEDDMDALDDDLFSDDEE